MARINRTAGLENPLQSVFPQPVVANRAPTTSDTNYPIGQEWIDKSSSGVYFLTAVTAGSATWALASPGASDVDTLTGDTGGALSPTTGNINILGGDGITVAGSGSTLTINRDAEGGYPVTQFVVGSSGEAGYTTIQAGIDAANSAGGGIVVVKPGTYTEDLTLYDSCHVTGLTFADAGGGVVINGTHTPPTTGGFSFNNVELNDATAIFSSAAAGSAHLIIGNAEVNVTNGHMFTLPNWTGKLECYDVNGRGGTNDGVVNNTGGAEIAFFSGAFGAGTGQTMTVSGSVSIFTCAILCPIDFVTGATAFCEYNVHSASVTFSNNSTGEFVGCEIDGQITMSSSGDWLIAKSVINTASSPAIDGSGAGTLTLSGNDFIDDATLSTSLTLASGVTNSGTFQTTSLTSGLTISGDDIDAVGSDANISITVSPKGTGDFVVDVGDIQGTAGDIITTRSSAGGDVTVESTNSDNTNAASRGGFEAAVGGTSAGDPYMNFLISGGQTFTMGIDNSTTNDDFVISDNATLGTNDRLSIDGSTGIVTLGSGLTSGGTTSINDSVNANTTINTGTSTGTVSVGSSNAGAITIDSSAGISIDGATASNLTVTGASQDLTLSSVGGSVNITSSEAILTAIVIDATDASGGVIINAGSNGVNVNANLSLTTSATQLQVAGGSDTDFIGTATLVSGTITIANTNIASTDRIFIQRQSINGSTAIGNLTYTISASTSFTITSVQDSSPGTTETNDVSIVNYFIVRQI